MKIKRNLLCYLISVFMAFSFFDATISFESFNENQTKSTSASESSHFNLPINADNFIEEVYIGKTLKPCSAAFISRNNLRTVTGFRYPRFFICSSLQKLFCLFILLCILRLFEIIISVNRSKIIKYIHDMDGEKD